MGAIVDQADVAALRLATRDPATNVWCDEVDVTGDGAFLHRVLFYPDRECEIMFRALALRMMPRADRSVADVKDRSVEGTISTV